MKTSIDTNKLIERINKNEEAQTFSLEKWVFSDLKLEGFNNILELYSGTGKQSEHIVNLSKRNTSITLSDVSREACDMLRENFAKYDNVKVINTDIDKLLDSSNNLFDMIFVSYGLYYSLYREDILCEKIAKLLKPHGMFTVVGPYSGNNYELFGFLSSLGVIIPRSVLYCSEEFMQNILCEMNKFSSEVGIQFAENIQQWDSRESLLTYWQNSTFYEPCKEEQVKVNLKLFFERNNCFQVTKKIAMFNFTMKG